MMLSEQPKIMRAIIYTRVSTKDQLDNYSLGTQEKICREFAEKEGWEIVKVFREEGESAKTANRTQLLAILEYCRANKGKVDILLVYKLDRFSRDTGSHQTVKAALSRYGVVLRSATESINESAQGKFMENIYSAVAQLDNDVKAERTRAGMRERVMQGLWAWPAPLGYKNSPAGLLVDTDKAPHIKRAFETYALGGYTLNDIARKLNGWGLRTRHEKKISPQQVSKILNCKLYTGKLDLPGWGVSEDGLHEPIISPDLFEKVRAIRSGKSSNNQTRLAVNPDFPLKSVVICNDCSSTLTGSWSKGRLRKYAYYHCSDCGKTRIPKQNLEESFHQKLKEIQPDQSFIKLFRAVVEDVWERRQENMSSIVSRIDKEIGDLKDMKTRLVEKNLNEVISDNEYKEQIEILNARIAVKEVDRSETRSEETDIAYLVGMSVSLFNNVSSVWLDASLENKVRFQSLLFPKGVYYEDGIIRTQEIGLPFSLIQSSAGNETRLVTLPGFEPGLPG